VPADNAAANDNIIFFVELLPPNKAEALAYLDHNGPVPARKARAVLNLMNPATEGGARIMQVRDTTSKRGRGVLGCTAPRGVRGGCHLGRGGAGSGAAKRQGDGLRETSAAEYYDVATVGSSPIEVCLLIAASAGTRAVQVEVGKLPSPSHYAQHRPAKYKNPIHIHDRPGSGPEYARCLAAGTFAEQYGKA